MDRKVLSQGCRLSLVPKNLTHAVCSLEAKHPALNRSYAGSSPARPTIRMILTIIATYWEIRDRVKDFFRDDCRNSGRGPWEPWGYCDCSRCNMEHLNGE